MFQRRSFRVLWLALIPVLVFPLYGQTSCNRNCPPSSDPCQRSAGRSIETGQCLYVGISGATCDYQGGAGICSEGQCVASECASAASFSICDNPLGGGLVGACMEDLCVLAAPEDQCVKVGVGRINCCSQQGCAVASGAYCNDPLDAVSCDPTGVAPPGQPGQDGICENGTCVAQTGLCGGIACPTSVSDPCARDYCDAETGQCEEWIVQTFTPCMIGGAEGVCQGGTCTPIGGDECGGAPCETSNPCKVPACRLPCLSSPGGCTPEELSNPSYVCEFDTVPDGAPCVGQPGECRSGVCWPILSDCRDHVPTEYSPTACNDYNPCTVDECDPSLGFCDNTPEPDGTPCAENEAGVFLGECQNGVCLPDLCIGRDCSDGDLCTDDICESPWGICSNPTAPDGTSCENNGQCLDGVCQPTITPECDHQPFDPDREFPECSDGNECTYDRCDFADQCTNPRKPNGTSCNNGNGQCIFGNCSITGF